MRKSIFLVPLLLPILLLAQTELGPFTFMDQSRATVYSGEVVIGAGGLGLAASVEAPAPDFIQFLNFIPGLAARYFLAGGTSWLYVEGLVISRARFQPRPRIIGFVGLGPGIGLGRIGPTLSVVAGADFMVKDQYMITVTARSAGMLSVGFGRRRDY